MSVYDDGFRAEMVALHDELLTDFQADGLVFAEHEVKLATVTAVTGANPDQGTPGTTTVAYAVIAPRPAVNLRAQWRSRDGIAVQVGDALVKVSRVYSRAALTGAAWWTIDGERYTLVEGELREEPNGLTWAAILKREAQ